MRRALESLTGLVASAIVSASALAETAEDADAIRSPTDGWNTLWGEVLTDITIIGCTFGLAAIYMLIRYRARKPGEVGHGPKLTFGQVVAWTLVPAALFMADDFLLAAKGWSLWNVQREVPANALEIKVTASQWLFEFDYGKGFVTDELVVPVGQPVVMRMTSEDVIHSFGLIEYRLKEDIMPGRITYVWFYPDKPLESPLVCVEFCGLGHSQMTSKVRAVPRAEYEAWLKQKAKTAQAAPSPDHAAVSTN